MTPLRLGLLIAEGAASAGRNIATDLRALSTAARHEVFSRAASLAEAGKLRESLTALGAPDNLARAAGQWPGVLQPARLSVERLPSTRVLTVGLTVLGMFCLTLALVQFVIGAILAAKVMPALAAEHTVSDPRAALTLFIPVQVVAWLGAVVAIRWAKAPWNQNLTLASHAIIGAALVESKAPTDVVTGWLASEPRLTVNAGHAVLAEDLRSVAGACSARAEASMRQFLAGFRFVAIGLLVLEGTWMVRDVMVTLSTLAGRYP